MADSNLNVPVIIQATRLDTSVLPRNIFSQSYLLYVIAQGTDVGNVANKANEAGQGAYDAQVRNDEQDVILADHEQRISAAEATLVNHEERISQAESTLQEHETRIAQNESDIASLDTRVQSLESQVSDHETRIDALEYATTRKKSEVVYSGVSVTIPTAPTNLVSMLKTPTRASSLALFCSHDCITSGDEAARRAPAAKVPIELRCSSSMNPMPLRTDSIWSGY
jgi:Tfp pilus assembly protein PilX